MLSLNVRMWFKWFKWFKVFKQQRFKSVGRLNTLNDLSVSNMLRSQFRGCVLNRLNDLGVARAATEIAGKSKTDLLFGGVGIFIQKRLGHHQHSRRAIAALSAAVLNKSFLDGMEFRADLQAFNRCNIRAVELAGKNQARVDRLAVEQNGARAAIAGTAPL